MISSLSKWLSSQAEVPPLLITCPSAKVLVETQIEMSKAVKNSYNVLSDTQAISIKSIRKAIHASVYTSWDGLRIVFIAQAERLSIPAAQALLKVLEEAPKMTRFVLLTRWPARLLPTILSRCQRIRISARFVPVIRQELAGDKTLLTRLASTTKDGISEEELIEIGDALHWRIKSGPPSRQLRRAYLRLRDYYFIDSVKGNRRLAADILNASLPLVT